MMSGRTRGKVGGFLNSLFVVGGRRAAWGAARTFRAQRSCAAVLDYSSLYDQTWGESNGVEPVACSSGFSSYDAVYV